MALPSSRTVTRTLKYTLLFGLLLSPVLMFTQLSLTSAEQGAEEVVQRGRASAVARVEQAIATFRAGVLKRVDALAEAAGERQLERLDAERGAWDVYVLERDLKPLYPPLAPAPPLEGALAEREVGLLYKAWLRGRDTAGLRRTAARLFWDSSSPRMQAIALARLATAAAAAGDTVNALAHLDLLLSRYAGARDVTGLPLGPTMSLVRVRVRRGAGLLAEARRAAVELVSDLTLGRWELPAAEAALWSGEARTLVAELTSDSAVPPQERDAIARTLSSPFPRLVQRLKSDLPGPPDGRVEKLAGRDYLTFERRVGEVTLVAFAPADEVRAAWTAALGSPYLDGYQVFAGRAIPAVQAERFEAVLVNEVPFLGGSVVLGADRAQLVTLRTARKTFLTALVSISLLMFFLAGYLIARDVRRHLELARLKSEFIANVGHELKTPLTTIRMFAETLFHGRCKPEREPEYLKKILTESDHLTMLIDNVLQLSRAEDVVIDSRLAETRMPRLVEMAVEQCKVRWEDRTIAVEVADVPVVCDVNLVVLAIANLLDNACKYGDAAKAIRVTGGQERSSLWCAVADEGRGIPAKEQEFIFQRFYRAKNALERKGMGLGLFLVQKIAEIHGGKVEFQSREGVGTTFTLRLPVRAAPAA